jgi:hypothetical protein
MSHLILNAIQFFFIFVIFEIFLYFLFNFTKVGSEISLKVSRNSIKISREKTVIFLSKFCEISYREISNPAYSYFGQNLFVTERTDFPVCRLIFMGNY